MPESRESFAPKNLLIAGGGTGGHVFPAVAVAREWLRRGSGTVSNEERKVVIVGTERGLEAKLVPQAGLPLELIRAAGLKGIGGTKFLRNLALLPAGLWDSDRILRRHNFSVAFGVGGYASGPMMLARGDASRFLLWCSSRMSNRASRIASWRTWRHASRWHIGDRRETRPQSCRDRLSGPQRILLRPSQTSTGRLSAF